MTNQATLGSQAHGRQEHEEKTMRKKTKKHRGTHRP